MNNETIDKLRQLNNRFYQSCAASFSETRQSPWQGWRQCVPLIRAAACDAGQAEGERSAESTAGSLSVADLACGNGRFGAFLARELPDAQIELWAVDSCAELAELGMLDAETSARLTAHFQEADIISLVAAGAASASGSSTTRRYAAPDVPTACQPSELLDAAAACGTRPSRDPAGSRTEVRYARAIPRIPGTTGGLADVTNETGEQEGSGCISFADALSIPPVDVVVSFGFLHHVPSHELRVRALRQMVELVRPGGVVVVSLWCFMEDERLRRKAEGSFAQAAGDVGLAADELEPGDWFLGWKDQPGLWRYCHSFDDAQADALSASLADVASEVARFRADGSSGKLNIYLAFQKQ